MKKKAKDVELFKNLAECDLNSEYYDLHNEFNCVKIDFKNKRISLFFKKIANGVSIKLIFDNAILEKFNFDNFSKLNDLTLDTLYRGRFEKENQLFEFSDSGKSYFYLEFYKGGGMEFWCDEIQVDKEL